MDGVSKPAGAMSASVDAVKSPTLANEKADSRPPSSIIEEVKSTINNIEVASNAAMLASTDVDAIPASNTEKPESKKPSLISESSKSTMDGVAESSKLAVEKSTLVDEKNSPTANVELNKPSLLSEKGASAIPNIEEESEVAAPLITSFPPYKAEEAPISATTKAKSGKLSSLAAEAKSRFGSIVDASKAAVGKSAPRKTLKALKSDTANSKTPSLIADKVKSITDDTEEDTKAAAGVSSPPAEAEGSTSENAELIKSSFTAEEVKSKIKESPTAAVALLASTDEENATTSATEKFKSTKPSLINEQVIAADVKDITNAAAERTTSPTGKVELKEPSSIIEKVNPADLQGTTSLPTEKASSKKPILVTKKIKSKTDDNKASSKVALAMSALTDVERATASTVEKVESGKPSSIIENIPSTINNLGINKDDAEDVLTTAIAKIDSKKITLINEKVKSTKVALQKASVAAVVDPYETRSSAVKRVATIGVGIFEICIVVGKLAYFKELSGSELLRDDVYFIEGLVLVAFLLTLLTFVMLIAGAVLRNSWLFMPYMIGQFFILGLNFYAAFDVISGTTTGTRIHKTETLFILAAIVTIVFAKVICWSIAYSYYCVVINRTMKMKFAYAALSKCDDSTNV